MEKQLKLNYTNNKAEFNNKNVLSYELSSSVNQNGYNFYVRNKAFARKFWFVNDLVTIQTNLEAGNIINLKGDLRNCQKLSVNHFKGFRNTQDVKLADNYVDLNLKFLFNLPILKDLDVEKNGIKISPFINLNALYAIDSNNQLTNNNNLRFSAGIGFSLITQFLALEFNYNARLIKNKNDLVNEFSINLGLD